MRVNVLTPWYPDVSSVYLGVFVEQQVQAVRELGHEVAVEVLQIFPAPARPIPHEVTDGLADLARRDPTSVYPTERGATWIPAPVRSRSGWVGRSSGFRDALVAKREILPVAADVAHAHLGIPTGAAAVDVVETPLVVTEHQSTLRAVLSTARAREQYEDVIRRAQRFFVVSGHMVEILDEALGSWVVDEVEIMPNIVDVRDVTFEERDSVGARWIYVGAMIVTKGIRLLVRAFLEYLSEFDGHATLTIVGDGDQREWVEEQFRMAGRHDALHLVGAIPRDELPAHLAAADTFVHMSGSETFGIASLEALGAGLPVVSLRNGGAEHAWGEIEPIAGCLLAPEASPSDVSSAVVGLKTRFGELDLAAARRFIEERYSAETIGRRLVDVYNEVLA